MDWPTEEWGSEESVTINGYWFKVRFSKTNNEYAIIDCLNTLSRVEVDLSGDYMGRSLTIIDYNAFVNQTFITALKLPSSLKIIDYGAFRSCKNLTSVTFGENSQLESIGDGAFDFCESLEAIVIPASVTSIGDGAFDYCDNLIIYCGAESQPDGWHENWKPSGCQVFWGYVDVNDLLFKIENNSAYLVKITNAKRTDVNIPSTIRRSDKDYSVIRIGKEAFKSHTSLKSVTFGENSQLESIEDYAFMSCTSLESITIPDSVTSLGSSVLSTCTSLQSIMFGENSQLTSIGSHAFSGCSALKSITLPFVGSSKTATTASSSTLFGSIFGSSSYAGGTATNQYYELSSSARYYIPTTLKSVTITGGNILYGAFFNCSSLTSIVISNSVTSIGDYAFYNCDSLESIVIPDSITSISEWVFHSCESLASIVIPNSVISIGDHAFSYCKALTSITIPNSVINIGKEAFADCRSLTSLTFEENSKLTNIGEEAFYDCTSLTSLVIPDSVTSICPQAFMHCNSLTSITIPASVTFIGFNAFSYCNSLTLINFNATNCSDLTESDHIFRNAGIAGNGITVEFGAGVEHIPANLFYPQGESYVPNLTTVKIPASVTSIGTGAFRYCTKLTKINFSATNCNDLSSGNYVFYNAGTAGNGITVEFGNDVKHIPAYLFYPYSSSYTPKITSVVIGNSVTSIGSSAFSYCKSLPSIEIPDSVTSIGEYAFNGCTSLAKVNYLGKIADWAQINFSGATSNPTCYAKNLYINNKLVTKVELATTAEAAISNFAFYACNALTSVVIGDNVTSIGNHVFCNCLNLTTVTIGSDVTSIGNGAFFNCNKLTSLTIGDSVTNIGNNAFCQCESLTKIVIPNSVTSIDELAFGDCTSLEELSIGTNLSTLAIGVFDDCKSLTSIKFNATNCGDLGENNLVFGDAGTAGSGITVEFGNNVEHIPANLFYPYAYTNSVPKITKLTIGSNVTSIGNQAFKYCTWLEMLNFNAKSCTDLNEDNNIFSYVGTAGSGITVEFGNNVEHIPANLFNITSNTSHYPRITNITIGGVGYSPMLKSVGSDAFKSISTTLKYNPISINYGGTLSQWAQINFGNIDANPTYLAKNLYVNNKNEDVFQNHKLQLQGQPSIGSYAFAGWQNLTDITITAQNEESTIGEGAFYGCKALKSITLPFVGKIKNGTENTHFGYIFGASYYSDNAGYVPTSLKEITLNPCSSLATDAFYGCAHIERIIMETTVADSTPSFGNSVFKNCTRLTSILYNVYNSTISSGSAPFSITPNSTSKTNLIITVGSKVNTIPSYLFTSKDIDYIIFAETDKLTTINAYAFQNCKSLKAIEIPNSVTSIGEGAFQGCDSLESVVLPSSATSIGNSAFNGCNSLTSIAIPASVTSIGSSVFSGCNNLTDIIITSSDASNIASLGTDCFPSTNIWKVYCYPQLLNNYKQAWPQQYRDKVLGNALKIAFTLQAIVQKQLFVPMCYVNSLYEMINSNKKFKPFNLGDQSSTTGSNNDSVIKKAFELNATKAKDYFITKQDFTKSLL